MSAADWGWPSARKSSRDALRSAASIFLCGPPGVAWMMADRAANSAASLGEGLVLLLGDHPSLGGPFDMSDPRRVAADR